MSAAWHDDVPDRTNDPAIRRFGPHRAVIAMAKLATRGRSYEFMRVLSIDRRLFRPFVAFNARLMPRGKLARLETEAVVLRTAAVCGSRYEWTQHSAIGRRAGLTARQIELIERDPASPELGERLNLLMRATDEILGSRVLSDATYDELRAAYEPARILELIMLIGNYAMLAGALNSFGARLEPAWRA